MTLTELDGSVLRDVACVMEDAGFEFYDGRE